MNFIAVFLPAAMIAAGIHVFCVLRKTCADEAVIGMMRVAGAVLVVCGIIFEFFAPDVSAKAMVMRAIVVLMAIAAVITSEVAEAVGVDSCSYSGSGGYSTSLSFGVRTARYVLVAMTVIISSAISVL